MKVLSETELSKSATSYRIEIDNEDLRTQETSEERYLRYLKQLRKEARLSHRERRVNPRTRLRSSVHDDVLPKP